MNKLYDLLLPKPLPDVWLHGLLFVSFTHHLLFVLLTLGTAILAVYFFIGFHWRGRADELLLDRRILRTFMAHKSLAVVLGVAPLLLVQIAFAMSFFPAVTLLAPYWLIFILLLIIAFVAFDVLGHGIETHRRAHLAVGLLALTALLLVPGILAAVVVTAENSGHWLTMAGNGFRLTGPLAWHWLFRYLHILGASLVVAATFHYFFTARQESGRAALLPWITGGIILQFFLGLLLYTSLLVKPDPIILAVMFTGILGASWLLWIIYHKLSRGSRLNLKTVIPLLMLVLVAMLLTRQLLQNKTILPLEKQAAANAWEYRTVLQPYVQTTLRDYQAALGFSYNNAETIYRQSCAFCHGPNADGNGAENKNLVVPAEDLTALRTTRAYLYQIILKGVPGTGMGYFTIYDRYQVEALMDYFDRKYQVFAQPGELPQPVSAHSLAQAEATYDKTCAACHGPNGGGSPLSRGFQPPPPDLRVYSLLPHRTFQVLTQGYPGTMMPAFADLPAEVRWGQVQTVYGKRRAQEEGSGKGSPPAR
jgi:mono/diheme cytochrome c family protein